MTWVGREIAGRKRRRKTCSPTNGNAEDVGTCQSHYAASDSQQARIPDELDISNKESIIHLVPVWHLMKKNDIKPIWRMGPLRTHSTTFDVQSVRYTLPEKL
jgi:hypothetical protein